MYDKVLYVRVMDEVLSVGASDEGLDMGANDAMFTNIDVPMHTNMQRERQLVFSLKCGFCVVIYSPG